MLKSTIYPVKSFTDYLDSITSSLVLERVNSSYWQKFIYKSTPIDVKRSQNASEVCSILDPVELTKCDMVLMDGLHCYFGNFSHDNNGTMAFNGMSWDLYIKQGY